MIEPMTLCSFLFSTMIVGAYETRPGIMYVEFMRTPNDPVEELYVYTEDYVQCWNNGVPVQLPGDTDNGGGQPASDSWIPFHI